MFPSSIDIKDANGNPLVTSYALHRPDGNWSIMLVNRDETNPHTVQVLFDSPGQKRSAFFAGPTTFVSFGSQQYVWINDGPNSHPDPDNPPAAKLFDANTQTTFTLPPASVNVIRGKISVEK
jgi:hypothetical protein